MKNTTNVNNNEQTVTSCTWLWEGAKCNTVGIEVEKIGTEVEPRRNKGETEKEPAGIEVEQSCI